MTSLPILKSKSDMKMVGIIESEDVRQILTQSKYIKQPGTTVRNFFIDVMELQMANEDNQQQTKLNECKEQDEDKYEQFEKNHCSHVNLDELHLRENTIILREEKDSLQTFMEYLGRGYKRGV